MFQNPVLEAGNKFEHVMALSLNPLNHNEGVVRIIESRKGDVSRSGFIDKSSLYLIKRKKNIQYTASNKLNIQGQDEIVNSLLKGEKYSFLGLEDPDIWIDKKNAFHLYSTMAFLDKRKKSAKVYLGHAEGPSLTSLKMTPPLLSPVAQKHYGAKEVSIAPQNKDGVRINLVESSDKIRKVSYSVIRLAYANKMNQPWKFGKIALHPKKDGFGWCAGHMSPGPLFPKDYIDVGKNRRLGILNGRDKNKVINNKIHYRTFSVGLMIYNYEKGEVEWVSKKPLIIDPDAETITFASEFILDKNGCGIIFAHVDDSFIRAYKINKAELNKFLAKEV